MSDPRTTTSTDAQRWQELQALLRQKAYKSTITPAEIAAALPDLRQIARQVQARTTAQRGGRR